MPQQIRENVFLDRMISILSAAFAVLATLLAAVGLYGVLAYTVAQRTREIGVRMALGADGGQVRRMVMRQVAVMMALGLGIGLVAALCAGACRQLAAVRAAGPRPGRVPARRAGPRPRGIRGGLPPGPAGLAGRSDAGAEVRIAP